MPLTKGLWFLVVGLSLSACSGTGSGWHWQHPQGLDAAQRERDLADCRYYASITDPRAFGTDRPVIVQEWEEPVRECMAKRGYTYTSNK